MCHTASLHVVVARVVRFWTWRGIMDMGSTMLGIHVLKMPLGAIRF